MLTLEFAGGPAALELGAAAEKWARKILHPPTRADKLGVKPGLAVRLAGEFDADVSRRASAIRRSSKGEGRPGLLPGGGSTAIWSGFRSWLRGSRPAGALWVVYPKGVPAIREVEVIQAGRAAGLKDTKVASFSPTHTALKFVIPRGGTVGCS